MRKALIISLAAVVLISADFILWSQAPVSHTRWCELSHWSYDSLKQSTVSIVRSDNPGLSAPRPLTETLEYAQIEQMVSLAVELAGGLESRLEPGDRILVNHNDKSTDLEIVGVVASPEYIRLTSGGADYVSDPSQFGVIFVPYGKAAEILDFEGYINNYVVRVNNQGLLDETMDEVGAVLDPYRLISITKAEDELGTSMLNIETGVFWKVGLSSR